MDRFGRTHFNYVEALETAKDQARPKRQLSGASILRYAERDIDHSVNLLGNRWLSTLTGGFVVAPSGHGKSSLIMQMAACWSCGKICCAIKPSRPLRIFIAQAEDDHNDVTEMAQMLHRLRFNAQELRLVDRNTHVEWLNDCTGNNFFEAMDELLTDWHADLLFINPYTAFQSEDIQDTEANANFLRVKLSKLLAKHRLGSLIVHHTGKTQFQKKKDFAWYDWMYDMAGGAVLTNWARAVLIIAPSTDPGTYKFIAAKRYEKIGWQERAYWFAHSIENDQMLWVPADSDQIATAQEGEPEKKPKSHFSALAVHSKMELLRDYSRESFRQFSKETCNIGRDLSDQIRATLIENGLIEVINGEGIGAAKTCFFRKIPK